MHLYLIGYRGTGKTTVGRLVAQQLGYRFLDTDSEIQQRAGCSIAELFDERGEEGFRDLEQQVLAETACQQQIVESLGGGAILREENRRVLVEAGKTVWLTASAKTIAERIAKDLLSPTQRPRLTTLGNEQEIEHLLDQRTPLYQQVANAQFATDQGTPKELAEAIARWARDQ